MIGSQCAKKGLIQLEKKGYIRIEGRKNYDKVYLVNLPDDSNSEDLFRAESTNPLYDLYEKNGDKKIGYCEICKRKYIITGNSKTCPSEQCSKLLQKMNKNKTG